MRFSDLCIDNYGVCRELNFQELRPGMLVIYGPNEAGKTTTMEFIRETLFGNGFAALSPHVIAPNQSQSGEIRAVDDEGNHWHVRRSNGTNPTLEIVINGQLHPSSSLNRDLLGGIGPQVFHNVFTVGIEELQELNQLNATGAATYLYEMTTGFDRVSLGNVLRRVTSERQNLEDQEGAGVLVELREEYARTKTKLDSHHLKITDWASCHNGITSVKKQLVDLDLRSADLNLRKRNLDVALILHGRHVELRQLNQLIDSAQVPKTLKHSPVFNQLEELVTLASDAELRQQQIFEDEAKLVEFEVAYKTLQTQLIPHELWLRIQAFQELLPWLKSLSRDVLEIEETDLLSSSSKQHRSHSPEPSRDLDLSVLSHRLLKELRQPAKEVRHTRSRLTKVQNELKELNNQLATLEMDWLENPAWDSLALIPDLDRPAFALQDTLQARNANISQLRTSISDAEALASSTIPFASDSPISAGLLSGDLPQLLLCGTAFSIGGTTIAMGLFFQTEFGLTFGGSVFCTIVGTISLALSFLTQIRESKRKQRLAYRYARQRELDSLQRTNTSATSTSPSVVASMKEELERELDILKVLGNLRKDAVTIERLRVSRQATIDRIANLEVFATEAAQQWRSQLAQRGIPEQYSPADLYSAVERVEELHLAQRNQLNQESFKRRKSTELADLAFRLSNLLNETQFKTDHLDLEGKLSILEAINAEQQDLRSDLATLNASILEIKQRLSDSDHHYAALTRQLINEYASVGVKTLKDLDHLHADIEALEKHNLRRSELNQEMIQTAAQYEVALDEVLNIAVESINALEIKQFQTDEELSALTATQHELHQSLGKLQAESSFVTKPDNLNLLRLNAAALKTQINTLQHSWKVWATSEAVSQKVRAHYEAKRQPDTLRDASQWLNEMTDGSYVRIWTPLGDDLLFVDDKQGQSWVIDTLSRGTRESIYLSLRLALVRSYQLNGISLPLILDDVLVNCDQKRASNAISALKRFADEVGQVLFFTCHSHIAALFQDAGADVRDIKRPAEVLAPQIHRLSFHPSGKSPGLGTNHPSTIVGASQPSLRDNTPEGQPNTGTPVDQQIPKQESTDSSSELDQPTQINSELEPADEPDKLWDEDELAA